MYQHVSDFVTEYRDEVASASRNWAELTDAALEQRTGKGFMSIGEQLWHIAALWQYIFCKDLKLWPETEFQADPPETAAELAEFYRQQTAKTCDWLSANWSDADLAGEFELWGKRRQRGKLLWELLKHEIHHRGQIISLMRMAGLRVHGIYGPGKEEVEQLEAEQ